MKRCKHFLKFFSVIFLSAKKKSQAPKGLFLNDWLPKNISVTEYNDAAKPSSAATVTKTVVADNVITKVQKYVFGNNSTCSLH